MESESKNIYICKKKKMYFSRNIENQIIRHLSRKEYTIIIGARQTGKSTLLNELYKQKKSSNEQAFYLTLEDPQILQSINQHAENLFRFILRPPYPEEKDISDSPVFAFIDEIQYASNPTNFLKYLFDRYQANLKIVATGSSAFYIDNRFKDSLAGRKRIFNLHTLSFDEYLAFNNQQELYQELRFIRTQKEYISPNRNAIVQKFEEYLVFGGYPAVALEKELKEKTEILKELRTSFLKRDVMESGVQLQDKFFKMLAIISDQNANILNKNEIATTVGIDNKTVDNYLFVLEKCFHIRLVKPFYSNIRKELTKMPKIFLLDNGFRNSILNRLEAFEYRNDKVSLFEAYVFKRLSEIYDIDSIRYWRTTDQKEIDFVVSSDFRTGEAFEIKISGNKSITSGIKTFREYYSEIPVKLLSLNYSDTFSDILKL